MTAKIVRVSSPLKDCSGSLCTWTIFLVDLRRDRIDRDVLAKINWDCTMTAIMTKDRPPAACIPGATVTAIGKETSFIGLNIDATTVSCK